LQPKVSILLPVFNAAPFLQVCLDSLARGFHVYERWLNGLIRHPDSMRERFIESPLPHLSVMLQRQDLSDIGGYREEG
jgi:hypothetical protein